MQQIADWLEKLNLGQYAQRFSENDIDVSSFPRSEKIVLVLEGIGDDKIRVNSSSLDHPLVILADQALEIVAIGKKMG